MVQKNDFNHSDHSIIFHLISGESQSGTLRRFTDWWSPELKKLGKYHCFSIFNYTWEFSDWKQIQFSTYCCCSIGWLICCVNIEFTVLCRLLAHARVESVKSKEAAVERERIRNSSWWSFGWYAFFYTSIAFYYILLPNSWKKFHMLPLFFPWISSNVIV